MRVSGGTIMHVVRENSIMSVEMYMKESGTEIERMVKEFTQVVMVVFTKEVG